MPEQFSRQRQNALCLYRNAWPQKASLPLLTGAGVSARLNLTQNSWTSMSHSIRGTHRVLPPEGHSRPNGSVVGIDICKDYFDAFFAGQHRRYAYSLEGIEAFMSETARLDEACFVMEATGNYFYKLALALVEARRKTYVVNPYRVKAFGKSRLQRHKSDKADARLIHLANAEASLNRRRAALRQLRTVRGRFRRATNALLSCPRASKVKSPSDMRADDCLLSLNIIGKQMQALLDDERLTQELRASM
jgi:transposase